MQRVFHKLFILFLTSLINFYISSCTGGSPNPVGPPSDSPGSISSGGAGAQPPPPQGSSTWTPTGDARRVMLELSLAPSHQDLECDETLSPQVSIWVKESADWQFYLELENAVPENPSDPHFCQKVMSSLAYFKQKKDCDSSLLKFKVNFKNKNGQVYEGESREIACAEREIKEGLSLAIELFPVKPEIPTPAKENDDNPHIFQKPVLLPPAAKK